MSRRGWVSAADDDGNWWRLAVYDDGWIELPGAARGLSDTRAQIRRLAGLLAAFAGLAVAARLVGDAAAPLATVLLVAALAVLAVAVVQVARFRARDRRQRLGDRAQARAADQAGHRVRRNPGAPLFRRAGSSAEYASWLDGVHRVAGDSVSWIQVTEPSSPAEPVVLTVHRHDGAVSTYRTPDRTAVRLLAPWIR